MLISKLVLGTAQLGLNYGINNTTGKPSTAASIEILKTAYENGVMYLDTAEAYGNAQEIIGLFHQSSSNKFKTVTKFIDNSIQALGDINKIVDRNRRLLQVDTLYGYLFHNIKSYRQYFDRNVFQKLKEQNKISNVGVSVYTNEEVIEVANNEHIDIVQLPFNLLDNMNLRGEVLKLLKEKGKEVHVRSIFLQGLFFMNDKDLPANLNPLSVYIKNIQNISEQKQLSIKHLAILYVLQNEFIDKVIIGVDSLQQLREHVNFISSYNEQNKIEIQPIEVAEKELLNPANW